MDTLFHTKFFKSRDVKDAAWDIPVQARPPPCPPFRAPLPLSRDACTLTHTHTLARMMSDPHGLYVREPKVTEPSLDPTSWTDPKT